jgi:hypothetical protein
MKSSLHITRCWHHTEGWGGNMQEIVISKYMKRFRRDTVYVQKKATSKTNSMGAVLSQPTAESALQCDIQPGGGSLLVAEYGERARNMLAVFADPGADIHQGDMVRVYAESKPDYRVEAAKAWRGHTRIYLEKV